jgi:hypothetical protein
MAASEAIRGEPSAAQQRAGHQRLRGKVLVAVGCEAQHSPRGSCGTARATDGKLDVGRGRIQH